MVSRPTDLPNKFADLQIYATGCHLIKHSVTLLCSTDSKDETKDKSVQKKRSKKAAQQPTPVART